MIDQQSPVLMFLVYVAVFVGVLLVFDGLRQLIFRQETNTDTRNRRMRMIQRGASGDDILSLLRDPAMLQSGSKRSLAAWLRRLLVQAGAPIGLFWFAVLDVALAAGLFIAMTIYLPPDTSAMGSIVLALVISLIGLMSMKEERAKKLTSQLPDALDLMARGLKVGHPLSVTISSVARDMADPIGSEFGVIQDQVNYGDDVTTAFRDFAERVGTEDAKYLAVSVGIQHGTGGNLARVLNVLSTVIRDRQIMRKKIKAISAEGRLSGVILSVLPIGIFLSIHLTTPSFYGDVQSDPLFKPFAVAIVTLMVAQAIILYRLVKFKF